MALRGGEIPLTLSRMKLTGKVALITNATHFMGPAITEEFCREGASLALHDRDQEALAPLRALVERLGRDVVAARGRPHSIIRGRPRGARRRRPLRPARHPRQQQRLSSDGRPDRAGQRPDLARDDRAAPRRALLLPPGRAARDAPGGARQDHQHVFRRGLSGPRELRGLHGRARRRQRAHQGGGSRGRQGRHSGQCHRPELRREPDVLSARAHRGSRQARAHGEAHSRRAPGARRGIGPPRRLPRLRGRGLLHRSGHPLRGRLGDAR